MTSTESQQLFPLVKGEDNTNRTEVNLSTPSYKTIFNPKFTFGAIDVIKNY